MDIDSITHKFLVVGHTQNEGDTAHSVIEKQIKKFLKSGPIYLPTQYVSLIQTAKKSGNPFKVKELGYSDFYDIKNITECNKKNFSINYDGEKVIWNDIKVLRFEKAQPNTILYKTSFSDTEFKKLIYTIMELMVKTHHLLITQLNKLIHKKTKFQSIRNRN